MKGGQYIENNQKIIGRNYHSNAYNAMGEKKMEEKINEVERFELVNK